MQVFESTDKAPPVPGPAPALGGVAPEEARAELERVLRSEDFPATPRNRRFLSFVVERALETGGFARRVTAHDVATRVFGRPDSFRTVVDPIVRIEAGKLRRDLETYYLKAGRANRVRIQMPRGGYDPVFTRQAGPPPEAVSPTHGTTGHLAADVRAELDRVLASPDFPATPRNRRFLSYAVQMELEGRTQEITAKHVALRVFGRQGGFNPGKDPIVRIEAGKLRRDLETYYLKAGRRNPLRLSIPRGGYRPLFTYRGA